MNPAIRWIDRVALLFYSIPLSHFVHAVAQNQVAKSSNSKLYAILFFPTSLYSLFLRINQLFNGSVWLMWRRKDATHSCSNIYGNVRVHGCGETSLAPRNGVQIKSNPIGSQNYTNPWKNKKLLLTGISINTINSNSPPIGGDFDQPNGKCLVRNVLVACSACSYTVYVRVRRKGDSATGSNGGWRWHGDRWWRIEYYMYFTSEPNGK